MCKTHANFQLRGQEFTGVLYHQPENNHVKEKSSFHCLPQPLQNDMEESLSSLHLTEYSDSRDGGQW